MNDCPDTLLLTAIRPDELFLIENNRHTGPEKNEFLTEKGMASKKSAYSASALNRFAGKLFAPIARDYEIWSRVLSFWQDPLWRREMVRELGLEAGSLVLDLAAGTGQVTRILDKSGFKAVAVDQSFEMLQQAAQKKYMAINARAESLPFRDKTFDGLTFTYLLRYADEPIDCMLELVRVIRPGGRIGMVEFGKPRGFWGPWWRLYTRIGLPMAGTIISPGWKKVGKFLGGSIEEFHGRYPEKSLIRLWERAGLSGIRMARPSLGGGLLMWGNKS